MKLRIKVVVERELSVDSSSYNTKLDPEETPAEFAAEALRQEKEQFAELLMQLIEDAETKMDVTMTMRSESGFPMAETHWKEEGV